MNLSSADMAGLFMAADVAALFMAADMAGLFWLLDGMANTVQVYGISLGALM